MLRLYFFLILAIVAIRKSDAVCGVCNANGMACVDKDKFQMCMNGTAITNRTYSCPQPNQICTPFAFVCADPSTVNVKPACGDTSRCGVCTGVPNGGFACTSRTTMTMCREEIPTNQRGNCREGYLCDPKNSNAPCVRECFVDEATICDLGTAIDEPVLPPTEPTTVITSPIPESTPSMATVPITTVSTTTVDPLTPTVTTPSTLAPTTTTSTTTTSTTTPSTTTTTTTLPLVTLSPSATVCGQQSLTGRYPFIDESNCSGYVFCFLQSGTMQSSTLPCPNGRYFNRNTRTCQTVKPVWCV